MVYMRNAIKQFPDFSEELIFAEPLMYTSYVATCNGHEAAYLPVKNYETLKGVLEAKLEEYNESVASMNLVLFDQAMEHISRIARIIDLPGGSALLVGVGGSGKQSLSRLASFICKYNTVSIMISSSYGINDLKADL